MEPENQIVLSDLLALNNVYMYGAAGTGKSFRAGQIKKILSSKGDNWDLVEVNCNQFTSPLDLIGGQTIEGYQKGKLEMAWTNVDADGKKYDGAILLLDELPKLDPNTAGLLNAALAKIAERQMDDPAGRPIKPTIMNGRGQKIQLGNMFVYATGNAPLNEADPDYEANFKQDLSLQDRFVGSMYKVFANYRRDREILNGKANDDGYLFIFNHMMKCREAILTGEDGVSFANKGFVSLRILLSMKRTFIEYTRAKRDKDSIIRFCPKSVIVSLNSFLEIFTERQRDIIKTAMEYDEFVKTAKSKQDRKYKFNNYNEPIMNDTPDEQTLSDTLVNDYEARTESIIECNP
jgi:cobaltochelatase CobS